MNKIICLSLVILLVHIGNTKGQENSLSELAFVIGEWHGSGWMNSGNGKITFSSNEKIRLMADGKCIVLEGEGRRTNHTTDEIVHSAFAVITYDAASKSFQKKGYKLGIESPFKKEAERMYSWSFTRPKGAAIKFTFDFSQSGSWIETGSYSTDGKTWETYMEIMFRRDDPSASIRREMGTALLSDNVERIRSLLNNGRGLHFKDEEGYSLVDYAVERNKPAGFRELLFAMVNEIHLNPTEQSLFFDFTNKDSVSAQKKLLSPETRSEMDLRGEFGSLLLTFATLDNSFLMAKLLLTAVENKAAPGQLPNRPNPNFPNNSGYTALPVAIRWNRPHIAELLIQSGSDVNLPTKSKYGATPLMEASRNGDAEMARLLLKNGANVNARDLYGASALNWGSYFGTANYVKVLLENGADCSFVGQTGNETALDIARREKHEKVIELLRNSCERKR